MVQPLKEDFQPFQNSLIKRRKKEGREEGRKDRDGTFFKHLICTSSLINAQELSITAHHLLREFPHRAPQTIWNTGSGGFPAHSFLPSLPPYLINLRNGHIHFCFLFLNHFFFCFGMISHFLKNNLLG